MTRRNKKSYHLISSICQVFGYTTGSLSLIARILGNFGKWLDDLAVKETGAEKETEAELPIETVGKSTL